MPPSRPTGPARALSRRRLGRRHRHRMLVLAATMGAAGWLAGHGTRPGGDLIAGPLMDRDRPGADRSAAPAPADATSTPPGTGGQAGRGRFDLAPDERAVTLARPPTLPPLEPGDRVELVAVALVTEPDDDPTGAGTGVEAVPLAVTGRVLHIDDNGVTLGLPAAAVPEVLARQAQGPVELVLLPG